jgi:hypothetical protein
LLLLLLPSLLPKLLCRRGGRLGSKVALLLLPPFAPVLLFAAAAAAGELPHSNDSAPGGCATGEEPRLWQRRLHAQQQCSKRCGSTSQFSLLTNDGCLQLSDT